MSEIKLVLADVDGTLTRFGEHELSERVREAIIAVENTGVRVAAVTGRPYEMAHGVIMELGITGPCVFDNGASIRDAESGALLWNCWLDVEVTRRIVALLAPHSKLIDYAIEQFEHVPESDEEDLVETPAPYVFAHIHPDDMEKIRGELDKMADITYYTSPAIFRNPDHLGLQINHRAADKFHGVEALRELVNISQEHTLAIGDGDNDIALFKNAGLKIAMGNAVDSLKKHADHVVATVDEDGFADAMDRFVLS